MEEKYDLRRIFMLRGVLEHTLFKTFMKQYDLPKGINSTHMMTLMILKFKGSLAMSQVSAALNMEKGSFTTVADKLIKIGYVESNRSERDRRVYELSLTQEGVSLAKSFADAHLSYVETLFEPLSKEKMDLFYEALDVVTRTIIEIGDEKEMEEFLNTKDKMKCE